MALAAIAGVGVSVGVGVGVCVGIPVVGCVIKNKKILFV